MGVPIIEVGYTSATTKRETTKFMTDMWWHWIKKNCGNGNKNHQVLTGLLVHQGAVSTVKRVDILLI
jgi:hypothetical protein